MMDLLKAEIEKKRKQLEEANLVVSYNQKKIFYDVLYELYIDVNF